MQRREFIAASSMTLGAVSLGRLVTGRGGASASATLTGPNYAPRGMRQWDTWYMPVGRQVHAYHLQMARPGASVSKLEADSLGHAVTSNLIDWEERPVAFGPNPSDPLDDLQPWTGSAVWKDGQGYLFYTMRGSANGGRLQRVGLATATNPDHWHRYERNPVIVPDPRWYSTEERPIPGLVDCRDLIVVAAPDRKGWFGFFATRQPGNELPETSVIGCAFSHDLLHWEQRPPAFAPRKFAGIEVPDVFELNGRWYLTCLAYGYRGLWSDPNLVTGTLYAVAEQPEGPYHELADSALIAARRMSTVSCRSVAFEGDRYLLYTDMERDGHTDNGEGVFGSLTTPKVLRTDGDRLYAAYSSRIESCVVEELIGPHKLPSLRLRGYTWGQGWWNMPSASWESGEGIRGLSRTGWGIAPLGVTAESFVFEATIVLTEGVAAGFAMRMKGPEPTKFQGSTFDVYSGAVVMLNAKEQTVSYGLVGDIDERRLTSIPLNQSIRLRVISRLEHVEIYIDDELRLVTNQYLNIGGEVGLFVDRAEARFYDIRLRTLKISRPS